MTRSVCPAIPWSSSPKRDLHFIEIKPRYGAFIADYRSAGDLTTMNEIINFHNGHYRISLLKSIYRVRNQIEADIIRLAAGRWTCENTRSDDFQKAGQHLLDLVSAGQAKAAVQDNVNLIRKNYQLLSGQDDLELG